MEKKSVRATWMVWCAVFLTLWWFQAPVQAQSIYGSVVGTVQDSSNSKIPGAEITVRNLATGLTRETTTNEVGFFRVTALPSGDYSVTAKVPEFETVINEPVVISVSVETTVNFVLRPAGSSETVEVSAAVVLMETTKSQLSKTVDSKRIIELPGRNSLSGLALLLPGTTPNNNNRPGSGFTVNGGRSRSNNFTIDGANNNDQSLSTPRQTLPSEAIAEFQLITNNFSAEYGRNSGSFVNVITKSGSNGLHGTVQWTWQGNGLDALTTAEKRTFNAQRAAGLDEKAALSRSRGVNVDNLGGATVGGPIKKDHTFFFFSYDRQWFRTTAVPNPTIALSPAALANLQANSAAFAPGALNFLTTTFPLANDPTPRGLLRVTLPNGSVVDAPLQQFNRSLTGSFPYGRDFYRFMGKIDTKLTNSDTLSGRYLIDDNDDPGSPSAIPGLEIGTALRNQSATFNEIHVFGPRTVNEARFTYARRSADFPENLPPSFTITGFNAVGNANFPQYRTDNMYEWTNNLSHSMQKHTLKAGVNILRYQLNSFFAPNSRGTVSYPSMTDFLLDRNANFSQYAGDGFVPARTTELGVFFQDDFRWTQNLTLNLGMRYEYTSAPFGFFSNAKADSNNWAPRFGFAWRPTFEGGFLQTLFGRDRTVFRGGYAISYDQVFQNILLNNARNFPRGVTVAIGPISGQRLYEVSNRPAPPTPEDFVNAGGNVDLLPIRLYSPNKRIEQPYAQQFSFGFERQINNDHIIRAYYVGSRGVNLVREVERNLGFQAAAVAANPATYASIIDQLQPVRNSAGAITAYRVDPSRGSILVGDGLAQSSYHSLQLTFERRFSRNLQFQFNYTFSSFVNDSDDILGGATNNTLPAVPFNIKLDRGRSGFDQPHRFVANYIYVFPTFSDNGVVKAILGDWQISGITTLAQGSPFTVFNANNALGILAGQIGTVAGSQRAGLDPNGTYPLPTSPGVASPFYIANPTNSGVIGNAGRNIERLGNTYLFDMALAKTIRSFKKFGEDHGLQVRWEVFNVFNRRNFTVIPSNTVSNSTNVTTFLNFGQTNVAGRSMLFTLRYSF